MKTNRKEEELNLPPKKKKKISEVLISSMPVQNNTSKSKIKVNKSSLYKTKKIENKNKNKNTEDIIHLYESEEEEDIIHLYESEEEEEEKKENQENEKSLIFPKSIEEIHNEIKTKYNLLNEDTKKKLSYKDIEENFIKFYDLDEEINLFFLEKLNEYYLNNKKTIDNSLDETSDIISEYFFTYIYTLKPEDKKHMMAKFNYFGKNELFDEKDKQFFHEEASEILFNKFIFELLDISNISDKNENYYLDKLNELYSNYSFPASKTDYKIPVKYNKEALYIIFILRFQLFLCTNDKGKDKKIIFKYNIKVRIKALNYFRDYLLTKNKEELGIEYIIFCLITFFKYYELYHPFYDLDNLMNQINFNFDLCSRFLYQSYNDKILYINKIKENIINIKEYNNYIINNKCFNNFIIKIKYEDKIYQFYPEDHFYYGDSINIIDSIIQKNNNNYNFNYLKKKKFPLFDDSSINEIFYNHVDKILKSPLTKEYFNSFQNLSNVSCIFDNQKILEEIKNNSFWVKFPLDDVSGVTDKDIFSVFLNNSIKEITNEKFFIKVISKITTISHENINHVARLILNINNILSSKHTPIHEKIFKKESYNKITKDLYDQGDKWEVIIFGKKIKHFYINSSLFLINTENYNLKINTFKKIFRDKQKKISKNVLKSYLNEILLKKEGNELIKKINELKPLDFQNCKDKDWINNSQLLKGRISIQNTIPCQALEVGLRGRFLENE